MLAQKRLLTALMRFANGESLAENAATGVYRDFHGRPILHVYQLPAVSLAMEGRVRDITRRLLKIAAVDLDLLEGRLAAMGVPAEIVSPVRRQLGKTSRPQAGPGWLVPIVREPHHWPVGVLTVALLTGLQGHRPDVLANRVGQCAVCQKFFLRGRSQPSRACSRPCRRVLAA